MFLIFFSKKIGNELLVDNFHEVSSSPFLAKLRKLVTKLSANISILQGYGVNGYNITVL